MKQAGALRKTLKIFHSIGSCGMLGAVFAALVLMIFAPQETASEYTDMRQSVAALSDYVLLPSMGLVVVTGLLAIAVHTPYMNKGWAWLKAGLGIVVFKGVLHLVGAHGNYADILASKIANSEAISPDMLQGALPYEFGLLWTMLALSVANIVLGVWRPRFSKTQSSEKRTKLKSSQKSVQL